MLRYLPLILANLRRRKTRTVFTIFSIAVAFLLYGLLAAVKNGFEATITVAGADRLITMHKVSIVQPLPYSYLSRIAQVPGVTLVTHSTWFGGHYQDERNVLTVYPVPPESYLQMYPDMLLSPKEKERWLHDRVGMIAGRAIAAAHGWKIGDRIPLRSDIYPRPDGTYNWEFVLDGIYDNEDPAGDLSSIYFHYDYLDESRISKGIVGWYIERVADPKRSAQVAAAIDAAFTNSSAETKTGTEKAFVQSFANQTGDIGAIIVAIGVAVFFTMLLVSANTMAQAVRERTAELGVLKTLGFSNPAVLALVFGESLLITLVGGGLGIAGALLLISGGVGTTLRAYVSAFLLTPGSLAFGVALMILLGLAAGALPGARASRLRIVDALARR